LENCGNVLIVDSDEGFRGAISVFFTRAGLAVEEASGGREALQAVRNRLPAVVLLEVFLPDISGYEICRELKEEYGADLPIIFISGERTEPGDKVAGLLIGADDYVPKSIDPTELLTRVRRFVPKASTPMGSRRREADTKARDLTQRERQVLRLLGEGLRSSDIATELVISKKTVASHIQQILGKLNVNSQAQAVAIAYREGWIGLSDERGTLTRPSSAV
jgi:DNA-binding NarL/FixJ family response regulator